MKPGRSVYFERSWVTGAAGLADADDLPAVDPDDDVLLAAAAAVEQRAGADGDGLRRLRGGEHGSPEQSRTSESKTRVIARLSSRIFRLTPEAETSLSIRLPP